MEQGAKGAEQWHINILMYALQCISVRFQFGIGQAFIRL